MKYVPLKDNEPKKFGIKCGTCPNTDGACYTSIPPQIKCALTNKFHYYNDDCDVELHTYSNR